MSSTTSTMNDALVPGELIPAEVNASIKRAGGYFPRKSGAAGVTVNEEGHLNNYAVEPQQSAAAESNDDEKFRQGVMFALATWVPIAIAFFVS